MKTVWCVMTSITDKEGTYNDVQLFEEFESATNYTKETANDLYKSVLGNSNPEMMDVATTYTPAGVMQVRMTNYAEDIKCNVYIIEKNLQ